MNNQTCTMSTLDESRTVSVTRFNEKKTSFTREFLKGLQIAVAAGTLATFLMGCLTEVKEEKKGPDVVIPVDPTDPTKPVDPTDPTKPVDPTDPTKPVDPTDPTKPVDPTDPTKPVDPTQPTKMTQAEADAQTRAWKTQIRTHAQFISDAYAPIIAELQAQYDAMDFFDKTGEKGRAIRVKLDDLKSIKTKEDEIITLAAGLSNGGEKIFNNSDGATYVLKVRLYGEDDKVDPRERIDRLKRSAFSQAKWAATRKEWATEAEKNTNNDNMQWNINELVKDEREKMGNTNYKLEGTPKQIATQIISEFKTAYSAIQGIPHIDKLVDQKDETVEYYGFVQDLKALGLNPDLTSAMTTTTTTTTKLSTVTFNKGAMEYEKE